MKRLGSLPKAAAWLLAIVMILAAVYVIGGIKLGSKYRSVEKAFEKKIGVPADNGISFASDISKILGFAQSIEASASEVLGDSSVVRKLADACSAAKDAAGNSADHCEAIMALYPIVNSVQTAVQSKDAEAASRMRGMFDNFNSSYNAFTYSYGNAYNEYVNGIKALEGGFPATAIKKLWGI